MAKFTQKEKDDVISMMTECGGAEFHEGDWPLVEQLVSENRAKWVSSARGPDRAFRRAEATQPEPFTNAERVMMRRALNMYIQHYRKQLVKHTDLRDKKTDRDCITSATEFSDKLFRGGV